MISPHLYVLLIFDGRHLFVPQDDVRSVEIIADVHIAPTSKNGAIGWFGQQEEIPVFCLAEDLSLLLELPAKREYFILLKSKEHPLGITCDEVEDINLTREHLHLQMLPITMKTAESPISHLILYHDKIGCVCSGKDLAQHLIKQLQYLNPKKSNPVALP